jgi:adenylate cyclase
VRRPVTVPGWVFLSVALVVGANAVAAVATAVTIDLMASVSEFAREVRAHDLAWMPIWRPAVYAVCTGAGLAYMWPIISFFRCGAAAAPPPPLVQRRAVSAPLVVAGIGFAGWLSGVTLFPLLTLARYGRWSTELMSQHILSPLVNGILATTTSYLVLDWVFRTRVIPHVFPDGRISGLPGALALRVSGRLWVFLFAVAFLPMFTMLGLVQAAAARLGAGMPVDSVVPALVLASQGTFALYVLLGLVLTVLLARTFTRPLGDVAGALRRVRGGALDQPVRVTATDEIGVLEEGVNAMAATLRERERILQTFGRVVEPVVRDRLLAGDLQAEGEERTATVLFCDLRGFTTFAERTPPRELVQTLNEFFTAMTAWARSCGGFVDKFIGDGVLVVFGLFDAVEGPEGGAAAALRCALGMRDGLTRLNAERGARGQPPLAMKVGVHTGPVVAGTLGAADRHEYTVVGDTVNVAARLEGLCGDHGCEMMVSATTWDLADAGGVRLPEAIRAAVTARGRGGEVQVYRVA